MKKQNKYNYKVSFCILTLMASLFFQGCAKSRVSGSATENTTSIYANPETIQFTAEDRAKMFKQVYLKLGYEFPPQAAYDAIAKAADNDAAKIAYEKGIADLISSGDLKDSLLDFFVKILGVGDVGTGTNLEPALLGTYVVLKNKPISEFFLADYGYDMNGNITNPTYTNGPPKSAMAGFMTTQAYFNFWANKFGFKWLREVLALGVGDRAPFPKADFYAWTDKQLAPKYLAETTGSNLHCQGCHGILNSKRGALHGYDLVNKVWTGTYTQGTDQYTEELNDSTGLEPRNDNGTIMATATAAKLFKLTENDSPISTPKQFAQQIVKHKRFASSWAERLIVYSLGLDPGSPGAPPTIPDNFSGNEAKTAFLEKWTTKLADKNFIASEFLKEFLTSADFLVTGYVDPNATPAAQP